MERDRTELRAPSRRPLSLDTALRGSAWVLRALAAALLVAIATTGAWPACGTDSTAPVASSDVDPGPTFGAEITVSVAGRGNVKTEPSAIDCPGSCFARVVLVDPSTDAAAGGIALVAEATEGAHFVGWSFDAVPLGMRARGPSQCSPMTRMTEVPATDLGDPSITLRFGETKGTPPRGLEVECDAFTTVPLAYAVTAKFEDDIIDAGDGDGDAGIEVLFEQPVVGTVVGKEIGVTNGTVYWRFERNGASGIAGGNVGGGGTTVVVQPNDPITLFDVDRHVVFQHSNGVLEAINGGDLFRVSLGGAPFCAAVTSDGANVYCRSLSGSTSSFVYGWPITGSSSATVLHTLPPGHALAADEQRLYFSRDLGGLPGQATIESAPRAGDGGVPLTSELVNNQTAPRDLTANGTSYLFWIDDPGLGTYSASAASKAGGAGQIRLSGNTVRFIAADPTSNAFWIGIVGPSAGGSTIVKASPTSPTTTIFRSKLTGLGGLAVDESYVYFTQADGRVYRAPKL